jgi:hypothetical protein
MKAGRAARACSCGLTRKVLSAIIVDAVVFIGLGLLAVAVKRHLPQIVQLQPE